MPKVLRLTDELFNRPHLATASTLDGAINYLNNRNSDFELGASKTSFSPTQSSVEFDSSTKIGVLQIQGPLTYRSTILTSLCGLTSYQKLEADFRNLVSLGAQKVVLLVDSGGGESYSCFETAALIRTLADQNGTRLITYCDGSMGSAAYALGAVAHEVILNPQALAGSIGVVVQLRNTNEALKKAGIQDTFVYSGKNKVPFNKQGDWDSEFISDIQNKTDALYKEFTQFVANYRKIPVKAVASTEAKMFLANDAVSLGLADGVMTREDFNKYLVTGKYPSSLVKASSTPINNDAVTKPKKPKASLPRKPIRSFVKPKDGVGAYLKNIYKSKK